MKRLHSFFSGKALSLLFILLSASSYAQVGINILVPDSSAILQLESNDKGLGLPRLTSAQRDAIASPLNGLTIFNTQDSVVEYWNGECWLKVYQRICNECEFSFSIDDPSDTLNRVDADSVFSRLTIRRLNGTDPINLIWLATPPQGVQIFFNGPSVFDSTGTVDIVVRADIFSGGGSFPVILQAFCGDVIRILTYNVYIKPCIEITIPVDETNYDLQARNASVLPPGARECVIVTVLNNVALHASDPAIPSYTTGNLDPASIVGIINNGAFLGRGGDGGFGGSLSGFPPGNPGERGGDAMSLTTRTVMRNFGAIYGGGSGGGSVGLSFSFNIPIVGSVTLGFGLGGGGGSESGLGGAAPSGGISIGLFQDGTDATAGIASVPGQGALVNLPINIPIGPASIEITPSGGGGNGGGYGQVGARGFLNITLRVCVSIPIIGNTCFNVPIPGGLVPAFGPVSGPAGLAIKRNNNPLTGLPDGNYNTSQVKGSVAP